MDIKILQSTPPWEWPEAAGKTILKTLTDRQAKQSDRLIAAELAGDLVVMNDALAKALLAVLRSPDEPEKLRARAASSFGAVLEQTDIDGFDDPYADPPITEDTFHTIQDSLQKLFLDAGTPKEVRRRVLEASVRASGDWHATAIAAAYSGGDRDWKLTAVFAMRWVRGFDDRILEALNSPDRDIHVEAVQAAGNWALDAAWSHVVGIVNDPGAPKRLRLAAIEAVGNIRPAEAGAVLADLVESGDEDIAEAVDEAMAMAEVDSEDEDDEDDEEDEDEDESDWAE
jgi:HEAT repeat protein